jgi:hypothetical protein
MVTTVAVIGERDDHSRPMGTEATMANTRLVSWTAGIWAAVTFTLCVVYGLVTPGALHGMRVFLEAVLPAFRWLTWWGFLLGLVEAFLYGAYAGILFCVVYNGLHRRFQHPPKWPVA